MKKVLAMCFDRRVLVGLALVAIGVWVAAPQAVLGVLPLLLLAACPLSMLLMGRAMSRGSTDADVDGKETAADRLTALEGEQAQLSARIARARTELRDAAGSRKA